MYKIKFIGPKYLMDPLTILGIEVYPADSGSEARSALAAAAGNGQPALIFITENISTDLGREIDSLNQDTNINVVLIPDNQGSIGLSRTMVNDLIKNSIGAEIILRR